MKLLLRLLLVFIAPLCVISFVVSTILIVVLLLVDTIMFIFTGKFSLADNYIIHYHEEVAVGWFVKFTDKLLYYAN